MSGGPVHEVVRDDGGVQGARFWAGQHRSSTSTAAGGSASGGEPDDRATRPTHEQQHTPRCAALQRGLDARIIDARELQFDAEFDAVFSNAALHWVPDPDAAIDGVWNALKPGGRFVAECGGAGCVASVRECFAEALGALEIDSAAADPWYFPTADEYRARLERRGFRVDSIELFPRPTPLPGDVVHWLEVCAQPFITAVPEPERAALLAAMRTLLAPRIQRPDGTWVVDYVRLRFAAARP